MLIHKRPGSRRRPKARKLPHVSKEAAMTRTLMTGLAVLALAGGAATLAQEPSLSVEKIVFATGVEDREPVGEATEFDASVGRVYCWTKVQAAEVPTEIRHVWSLNGEKVSEVALQIRFPSTRTWSYKTISAGNWKVEVVDDAGTVISSAEFTVN
jgi:hypothetical protein